MAASVLWLSCGVLKPELETLVHAGRIPGQCVFLDSMLHMDPPRLERTLEARLGDTAAPGVVVLVYGDCCPGMFEMVPRFRVLRVNAINCAQMLLGSTRYRELMRQEAFLLLPEWTGRWREVFVRELALAPETARECMGHLRTGLVYLDTGCLPVPERELRDCADFTGLPSHIEAVGLENLERLLLATLAAPAPGRGDR